MALTAVFLIVCGEYTYSRSKATPTKSNNRKTLEENIEPDIDVSEKDAVLLKAEKDGDDENENETGDEDDEEEEGEENENEVDESEAEDYEEKLQNKADDDKDDDDNDDDSTTKEPTYQIIFSTDCSDFQHWQSYLLFYSAHKQNQKGYVTRIASGCKESEQTKEQAWHTEHIQSLNPKFLIHFTPKFSSTDQGKDYKFFNKPFGLRHWMEHGVGMGVEDGRLLNEEDVVMLLDPDMFLLRPLTHDFRESKELTLKRTIHPVEEEEGWVVKHGQPFAQLYGYGSQWQSKIDLAVVTGDPDTNAAKVNGNDARWYYPMGPPYIATARDMYNIAIKWTEFAPGVHKQYPYLLAEMFAYSIAAAHLNLPHQPIESLMLSSTPIGIEGWDWIDKIPIDDICSYPPTTNLPFVFHYCQRYIIKDYLFAKRKPQLYHFFTCDSPLFREIDVEDVKHVDYKLVQNSTGVHQEKIAGSRDEEKVAKRQVFSLCTILSLMNEASMFLKENYCDSPNLEKSLNLWDSH